MATATPAKLMTVEEFLALPERETGAPSELHFGEVAEMTFPKFGHAYVSRRFLFLLEAQLAKFGYVDKVMAFRAIPQNDIRAADVGFVSHERLEAIDHDGHLMGAPDLVIEVLSPSNSAAEMNEREILCLENGALEFWTVNLNRKTIHVASRESAVRLYRQGMKISLAAFGGGELSVDEVFS